jgi:hypothetical protein
MHRIRLILKAGSTVFGLSAVLLVATPGLFLDLLNLDGADSALQWSMRMIGITLVALAGNMWVNSENQDDKAVETVGIVMAISATSLGVLTLLIPVSLLWFAILYAIVGFGFGAAYFVALILIKQIK